MATRVLILSAGIGEGHNLPARMIEAGLLELDPQCEVVIVDSLAEMGRAAALLIDDSSELMFDRFNWLSTASTSSLRASIRRASWASGWRSALAAKG